MKDKNGPWVHCRERKEGRAALRAGSTTQAYEVLGDTEDQAPHMSGGDTQDQAPHMSGWACRGLSVPIHRDSEAKTLDT